MPLVHKNNIGIITFLLVGLLILILPTFALAAFNDVTLTTDAVIQVGGHTVNVSGSSAVFESIVVDTNSFTVTLASGSSVKISSPDLYDLSSDISSDVIADVCTGSESSLSLSYSGAGTVTNTITVSATQCADASPTPAPSSGSSSGRSSGRSVLMTLEKPAVTACPAGFVCVPVASSTVSVSTSTGMFLRNLSVGSVGDDVKWLQQYLNARGFTVAKEGPGSLGNETTMFGGLTLAALIKFQIANHISPAVGFFGPITRAFVSTH